MRGHFRSRTTGANAPRTYDERYVWDGIGLFRPFLARVSVWVPPTQTVGLGFVISPLWGSAG
jgi:hypothetical protein